MERFTAMQIPGGSGAWYVRDNMAGKSPEFENRPMAVSIYFKSKSRASAIAGMMNVEWQDFLQNPF